MNKKIQPSQIVIYATEDGQTKVNAHFESETVWLTQKLMAELFGVSVPTINEHLKNIFFTQELNEKSVIRNFRTTWKNNLKAKKFAAFGMRKKRFGILRWLMLSLH